ncbi:MAG: oligoendopeptidase F, partial [Rhodoferax sp.]|nr:oligoendopeptidase F [Rhodoferax sp.]
MQKRLTRAEVPVAATWSLNDLFPSETAWEVEYLALDQARVALGGFQGQLASSAARLLACLDAVEAVQARMMRFSTFAYLRNAQDGSNPEYQAAIARVAALGARISASVAFVDSEILAMPDGLLEQCMASEPGLSVHQLPLQRLLELRPHRLGAD